MPFPLAHPAAVVPLRRYCPRWLNFPALVVGSFSADLSYLFSRWHVDDLAHQPLGGFLFSVPAGLLFLSGLYFLEQAGRRILPGYFHARGPAPATPAQPALTFLRVLMSVWLGAVTHVLWDSFTHNNGWLAEHLALFRTPLFDIFGHDIKPVHLLWYLSSVGGAACMAWLWLRWREQLLTVSAEVPASRGVKALGLATLIVPIAAAHHLVPPPIGNVVAGMMTLCLVGWMLAMSRPRPVPAVEPASALKGND